MKNLIKEIFGRGYSWSYRWYRIKELFDFMPSYYELTIIPAIVLAALTGLGFCVFNAITIGVADVSLSEVTFFFIFYLFTMTLTDVIGALRRSGK